VRYITTWARINVIPDVLSWPNLDWTFLFMQLGTHIELATGVSLPHGRKRDMLFFILNKKDLQRFDPLRLLISLRVGRTE
jgi:hypothetical protein